MRNVPELNGLRGIAVLAVFFHHACYASLGSVVALGWNPEIRFLGTLFRYGDSGVDLFFVLSGFLITSILLRDRASEFYYQDFYWKRLLRIGPVLVVALIGTLFLGEFRYALVSIFMMGNFAYQLNAIGTAPFWSLAIEEQFYLVWPTVIRKVELSSLRRFAVAIIICTVLLRYLFAVAGHANYHLTFLRIDTLAMGALLSIMLLEHRSRSTLSGLTASMFIVGTACLVSSGGYRSTLSMPTRELGVALVSASVVYFCVCYSGTSLLAPLRGRVLLFFAEISYAMYLLHLFIFHLYDRYIGVPVVGNTSAYWTRLAVLSFGSIAVALLSRYTVELPFLSLRTRLLSHASVVNKSSEPPLPLAQM
jgi:peptidoglycan/LPS O-acetylase OafA/YrhL